MLSQGTHVEFDGPGPFELPKSSHIRLIASTKRDVCFLTLELEGTRQRVVAPISVRALRELKTVVDAAVVKYGVGERRH